MFRGIKNKGFTLLELMIVISIIAILAAAIIPNFVGFDTEARVATTQSNLSTLRTRVTLFRAKEGRYPDTLEELTEKSYDDLGVQRLYLEKMPVEMISNKNGNATVETSTSETEISGDGGWAYIKDRAQVVVNSKEPLPKKWGPYENQEPDKW